MSILDMSGQDTRTAPLKPAVFHILLALAEGDRHGYAVMRAVRERSGGLVPLQTGSFYRHLARLIDDGLVAEVKPSAASRGRHPMRGVSYRLTPAGRRVMTREHERLAELVDHLTSLGLSSRRSSS
jgi:DNA-binding PadR family transcriptional regulator